MLLYLTGAQYSLKKATENPQPDPAKSLGGFVSSTPVPNNSLNALFDLISTSTIANRPKETIAIALINKYPKALRNLELKIVVDREPICGWKIAAVPLSADYGMEHIDNRYAEPMIGEFYDATFQRAAVRFKILNPPVKGDSWALIPLGLEMEVLKDGYEGAWNSLKNACAASGEYECKRLSEKEFLVEYKDDTVVPDDGIEVSFIATGGMTIEFESKFANGETNSVLLISEESAMEPESGIGLWIQRQVSPTYEQPSNEELVRQFLDKTVLAKTEEAQIVITGDFVEESTGEGD